jgi:putative transcriptional regulator
MKTELQNDIIHSIREMRHNDNLSQAGLGDILDISYGLVGNIESTNFSHKYTLKQLQTACIYFNHPFENLFLSEEELILGKDKVVKLLIKKIIEYNG